MRAPHPELFGIIFAITALVSLTAQIPSTLRHSIPPPPVGVQSGAQLGYSVAVDGAYTLVGAPLDSTGEQSAGVVKVFNSATGQLHLVLPNPDPWIGDTFGNSVAISGTRVAVGAVGDGPAGFPREGSVYVYDLSSATPTVPVAALRNPEPQFGDGFGWSVALSGTLLVVGAYLDDMGAVDAGSAYVFDLDSATPTVPVATLNNPGLPLNPAVAEQFGYSVAISGTRVVVGTPSDDERSSQGHWGSAYIYDLSSATPTIPAAALNDPGPPIYQNLRFGSSVAISGARVVVGASGYEGPGGPGTAGHAYVYDLSSATPTAPLTTLSNPSTPTNFDLFGWSVAISGTHVVVGARGAGKGYVFDLGSATPTAPVATLNNPNPAGLDRFGSAVAISGTEVVVGAYLNDMGALDAGSAYVYDIASATPAVPVATLNHPGPGANDRFGHSVALSGTRMVVSALGTGKIYVYDLGSGSPTAPLITLEKPSSAANAFGQSVAVSGRWVVVGAGLDDTKADSAGSAYVYDLSSATPTIPAAILNNPAPPVIAGDRFGFSVAISGTRVAIGAPHDDTGGPDLGSVYVYDLSGGMPMALVATLNNPSPPAGSGGFGRSVAISGTRVVVGAGGWDPGAWEVGKAYVFDLSSDTPTVPTATLNNPSPAEYDYFGLYVGISGMRVVVSAYRDDTGERDAGSVYVYDLGSDAPTVPVATLNNPNPKEYEDFGFSLSISDTRLVVGVPWKNAPGISFSGTAYLYDLVGPTPTLPVATLTNPAPAEFDKFGFSVAIDGTTVAIGTPFDNNIMLDKGYVYIFEPNPNDQDADGLRDSWELAYWPTTAGHGPLGDWDGDGYPELLELAFGLDPRLADAGGMPPVSDEGGYLTTTISKRAGVSYEVQSAGTLEGGQLDSFSAAATKVVINTTTTLKVRDTFLIGTAPCRFLRVKVTAAP